MKKNLQNLLLLVVALMGLQATAAIPSNYYNNALGKSDQQLMTSLHQIIKGHYLIYYGNLWEKFKTTDCNGTIIIDRYSTTQFTYSTNQCTSSGYSGVGDCYNREHSVPNSWWGAAQDTMYSDLFHMYPVDGWVNGQRGNYPYGDCANGTACGTGKLGTCTHSGYTGTVFEVADEYKGDFARTYFYMAVRYMDRVGSWTQSFGSAVFTNSSYKHLTPWAISQLLEWHRNDPVSTLESNRNEAVYGIQHNRNPFIDHPELAEYLWGNNTGSAWSGSSTNTPVLSSPSNGTTINVGTNTGSGVSKTITVKGVYLTKSVTVSVSGTGFSVTPTSLTAAAVNAGTSVTVTYNGTATNATGSLTISSTEVSSNVTLTATYNTGGGTGGTETIETWEGCDGYGNYNDKAVQGKAFAWYFHNAGLFAQENDHWNDAIGCRFGKNADSYIEMTQDVADGASKLTFYACKYGSDATPTIQVQYSTNGGSSWVTAATCSPTATWQQYIYNLDITGNVRFKFVQTAGSRLNIDDIAITSNSGSAPTPELTAPVNGSTVNVGTITATGTSVSKTITVKGINLAKSLTVSTTGSGFSVSPATISATAANNGTNVTVTYSSSNAGNATGTMTISSSEVSATVNLTASKIAMPTIYISSVNALEAEQNGTSSIVTASVSTENNTDAITLSVEGNFELSLNRYTWAKSLMLDASGETFYVRLADTGTAGEYYGSISATTPLVSAYADVMGTVNPKSVTLGDVNMDGRLSIDDVTTLIGYLLTDHADPFDSEAADVNEDHVINISDVTTLINILLTEDFDKSREWIAVPVDGGIMIENPSNEALEVYDMDAEVVAVSNSSAMIDLPAGIYLVSSENTSRKVVVK